MKSASKSSSPSPRASPILQFFTNSSSSPIISGSSPSSEIAGAPSSSPLSLIRSLSKCFDGSAVDDVVGEDDNDDDHHHHEEELLNTNNREEKEKNGKQKAGSGELGKICFGLVYRTNRCCLFCSSCRGLVLNVGSECARRFTFVYVG